MRALHINDYRVCGGAEVQMALTLDLLRAEGVEVETFTADGVPGYRRTPLGYIDNGRCRAALRRKLEEIQPEIAHLHNFYHALSPGILAELAAYKQRRPLRVLMTAHDYHLICPNAGACWFSGRAQAPRIVNREKLQSLRYLCSRRWDHRGMGHSALKLLQHLWNYRVRKRHRVIERVICPSRFMRRIMQAAGFNTVFLPNPVSLPSGAPAMAKPAGPLRVVFAGRVEPEKGLHDFFNILDPDFEGTITVIGEGSELERCRQTVRQRKLDTQVAFLGWLPHAETLNVIASCHVLALPSLWWENCPMSLLEALAAGTNILVSDLGGMAEIVQAAGVGFSFAPGDQRSLRNALDAILPALRDGSLNRYDLSRFLAQRTEVLYAANLTRLYQGIAEGDARPQSAPARLSIVDA